MAILGIRQSEANTQTYIGRAYNNLGQRQEALKDLNEAHIHLADVGNRTAEKTRRGRASASGQLMELKRLKDALPNLQEMVGRAGEASTLDNLGDLFRHGPGRRRA